MSFVRLLVLPIFRRHWLFHATVIAPETRPLATEKIDWRSGVGLEGKLQLLGEELQRQFRAKLVKTWEDLENAKDGSFQNRLYRIAQGILSREDPQEESLRSIPSTADVEGMEILHPKSLPERLVRRRLRLMVKQRISKHKLHSAGWTLGLLPLLPLLATPIPNIPLYYAGYRAYSNYGAWSGSCTIQSALLRLDARGMQNLRTDIEQMRAEGFEFPGDSWAIRILKEDKRYLDLLDDAKQRWVPQTHAWELKFVSSEFLDKYSCPEERKRLPLGDEAAIEIGHQLGVTDLIKSVARARRRATGSMFPTHVE